MKKKFTGTLGFSSFKMDDTWHYEVRSGHPLNGKLLLEGHGFPSNKVARRKMNYELRKIYKK